MVVVFLCIYWTKIIHDNKLFPARKLLTLCTCAVDSFSHQHFWNGGDFCSLFSMCWTKFDAKMTKSKWNYTANMIMNVSGTVCQRIHYFPGKPWLANDPTWPALKVNKAHGFDIISWSFCFCILLFISDYLDNNPCLIMINIQSLHLFYFLMVWVESTCLKCFFLIIGSINNGEVGGCT